MGTWPPSRSPKRFRQESPSTSSRVPAALNWSATSHLSTTSLLEQLPLIHQGDCNEHSVQSWKQGPSHSVILGGVSGELSGEKSEQKLHAHAAHRRCAEDIGRYNQGRSRAGLQTHNTLERWHRQVRQMVPGIFQGRDGEGCTDLCSILILRLHRSWLAQREFSNHKHCFVTRSFF